MNEIIPSEEILGKIYTIRGIRVMLDSHIAELYNVETKALKQAVKRNISRFPDDFMFELTKEEHDNLRSQNVTSSWGGIRYMPLAFTENGVAMLSSVLRSERAIRVNIQIMRAFTALRKMIYSNEDLRKKIELMEKKYDHQFKIVFDAIKSIIDGKSEIEGPDAGRKIGF
jgi:hypothetical protein